MERRLFLIGPTGCGKSSLLVRALGPRLCEAGGFVTRASFGAHGELSGFTLAPAAAAGGVVGLPEEPFLDCRRFPPRADNEVFRGSGVRLLREAAFYPYALLDEIGGFELIIPPFRTALEELLRSELPVVGALRTEEEARAMRRALGLGDKVDGYVSALHTLLAADPDTRILSLEASREEAEQALDAWVDTWL